MDATRQIEENGGEVIERLPNINYYLVNAGVGKENSFMEQMRKYSNINFISLDAFEYINQSKSYAIDNFNGSHGDNVSYSLEKCDTAKNHINRYNAGKENDDTRLTYSDIDRYLYYILESEPKISKVINMSFGPSLEDLNSYTEQYKEGLIRHIKIAANYNDRDFVIVKSAGNDGLKDLDKKILNDLEKSLTIAEKEVLRKHFILVSAKDTRDPRYSNAVSKDYRGSLVANVDISDLARNGKNLIGTSFAAPSLACFINSVANKHDIKVTETLDTLKKIIAENPTKIVTYSTLDNAIANEANSFRDNRDNKTYRIAKIGSQTWMAQNLNYETSGSRCYGNIPGNCAKYGRLYYWAAAKNACPPQWHLPSSSEWKTLQYYAGEDAAINLKSKSEWKKCGGINGTDVYGFNAIPDPSTFVEVCRASWFTSDEFRNGGMVNKIWSIWDYLDPEDDTADAFNQMGIDGDSEVAYVRCVKTS